MRNFIIGRARKFYESDIIAPVRGERTLLQRNWTIVALVVAAALLISPLWLAGTPAMPDYPARLAGFYLIGGGGSAFYAIHWAAIPNLAGEIAVPFLARFMALDVAARLFLSVGVAMWVAGPALIQRALYGRVGVTALAASFFALNVNFMWGFLNYYFAAGLCMVVFAGWIASAAWPRAMRLAVFAGATVVLYFCHILAAGLFLLLVACFEMGRGTGWRAVLGDLAVLTMPVAVLYVLKPVEMGGGIRFELLGTFLPRVASLVQWRFDSPAWLVIAALAILFAAGLWRSVLTIHRQMRVALIVLVVAALSVPEVIAGGWGLHLRFPAVAAALLFAASDVTVPRRIAGVFGAAILAILGWMSFALAQEWRAYDAQIGEFRAALRDVPRGNHLMTAVDTSERGEVPSRLYWHMAEFAIMDRDAMTALMFATPGQHVVILKPAVAGFAAKTAREGTPPQMDELERLAAGDVATGNELRYLSGFPCHYDEVVLIHANGRPARVPGMLRLRRDGSFFGLYDVAAEACSTRAATRP
jgi:hypothetical protein